LSSQTSDAHQIRRLRLLLGLVTPRRTQSHRRVRVRPKAISHSPVEVWIGGGRLGAGSPT